MLLQFKIQLQGITKPPVWRKVLVPGNFTLHRFHQVIQAAFGWGDYHLYQFSPQGYGSNPRYGIPDEFDDCENSKKVKLSDIFFEKGQKFTYIYDFGDDWIHKISLEEIKEGTSRKASFVSGKGACPPEDCGGVWGYETLLETINNLKHPEYRDMREWLGMDDDEEWDKNFIDLEFCKESVEDV